MDVIPAPTEAWGQAKAGIFLNEIPDKNIRG
jgi:hypothetical protein